MPQRFSKGLRTSCSPIISARVLAPKRASSSSCLSQEAHESGFAVAKVRYCCCRAPAPQTNGARCGFFACAPPRGVTPTGGALDCEFRGFENEVNGKASPLPPPTAVLSMPVARPCQRPKMSPKTPKMWLEPKWVMAHTHTQCSVVNAECRCQARVLILTPRKKEKCICCSSSLSPPQETRRDLLRCAQYDEEICE